MLGNANKWALERTMNLKYDGRSNIWIPFTNETYNP